MSNRFEQYVAISAKISLRLVDVLGSRPDIGVLVGP